MDFGYEEYTLFIITVEGIVNTLFVPSGLKPVEEAYIIFFITIMPI